MSISTGDELRGSSNHKNDSNARKKMHRPACQRVCSVGSLS
jgi:hypothetical protein